MRTKRRRIFPLLNRKRTLQIDMDQGHLVTKRRPTHLRGAQRLGRLRLNRLYRSEKLCYWLGDGIKRSKL